MLKTSRVPQGLLSGSGGVPVRQARLPGGLAMQGPYRARFRFDKHGTKAVKDAAWRDWRVYNGSPQDPLA